MGPLFGIGMGTLLHPLQHSKVLIQLGYEPLPLRRGKSWWLFGEDGYILASGFELARHIYRSDGLRGLYRGYTSSVCGSFVSRLASVNIKQFMDETYPDDDVKLKHPLWQITHKLAKESVAMCAGAIAAKPFQVIMIRCIAQRIGDETHYAGICASLLQGNKDGGIKGLFAGLIPQLIGDLCVLWTWSLLMQGYWRAFHAMLEWGLPREALVEFMEDESVKRSLVMNYISANHTVLWTFKILFYPFQLVSAVMAVNGCGLAAGMEPHIRTFISWTECYRYLMARNQGRRGMDLFYRFYNGPVVRHNGEIYAAVHQ